MPPFRRRQQLWRMRHRDTADQRGHLKLPFLQHGQQHNRCTIRFGRPGRRIYAGSITAEGI
jgi:hypothetical protein